MVSQEIRQAKQALVSKKRELTEELKRVDQAIRALDEVMGASTPTRSRGKRSSGVKEAIISVLRESGHTMHADDIVEAVKARGIRLSAADPKATVVTGLLRLRDAGEVMALGRNQFRWRSDEPPEPEPEEDPFE